MAYDFLFFDEVITDIQEIKLWYKGKREGLEIEFVIEINKAIQLILSTPMAYAVRYRNIRIAHPKVFPYNIHFYIDEIKELIVITAIIHNRRHSGKIKKRGK